MNETLVGQTRYGSFTLKLVVDKGFFRALSTHYLTQGRHLGAGTVAPSPPFGRGEFAKKNGARAAISAPLQCSVIRLRRRRRFGGPGGEGRGGGGAKLFGRPALDTRHTARDETRRATEWTWGGGFGTATEPPASAAAPTAAAAGDTRRAGRFPEPLRPFTRAALGDHALRLWLAAGRPGLPLPRDRITPTHVHFTTIFHSAPRKWTRCQGGRCNWLEITSLFLSPNIITRSFGHLPRFTFPYLIPLPQRQVIAKRKDFMGTQLSLDPFFISSSCSRWSVSVRFASYICRKTFKLSFEALWNQCSFNKLTIYSPILVELVLCRFEK